MVCAMLPDKEKARRPAFGEMAGSGQSKTRFEEDIWFEAMCREIVPGCRMGCCCLRVQELDIYGLLRSAEHIRIGLGCLFTG